MIKKRILHISTTDKGGAGSAAYNIHSHLVKLGYESTMLVNSKTVEDDTVKTISERWKYFYKGKRYFHHILLKLSTFVINQDYLFFSIFDSRKMSKNSLLATYINSFDIIIVHWVARFISLEALARIVDSSSTKVIINQFDMAHMTGGCHYSFDCRKYETGCISCPQTTSSYFKKLIRKNFIGKKLAVDKMNANSMSFTPFVKRQAANSAIDYSANLLYRLPMSLIAFKPYKFTKGLTIFVGAYNKKDKRKGFNLFILILTTLSELIGDKKIELLLPEGQYTEINFDCFNIQYYSFANSDTSLSAVYNKADMFLSTSLDDSGPVMLIQALACGLPVISHRVGYAADLIEDGLNGFLVDYMDHNTFAQRVYSLLFSPELKMRDKQFVHNFSVNKFNSVSEVQNIFDNVIS